MASQRTSVSALSIAILVLLAGRLGGGDDDDARPVRASGCPRPSGNGTLAPTGYERVVLANETTRRTRRSKRL
jgi:hypothetical protein